ncbi:MAG: UDP-N-acetylmuramoyl-L-alanine--D-glutamate ligase [Acidothermales bacterium]|jgi:UDP-N-acetylmuramoylalanine--D-glutamate ligase|nr:UDP-N-acetylmuramoyl-L-alanine--D-glutamate ligase [Acidothermales bacterium]
MGDRVSRPPDWLVAAGRASPWNEIDVCVAGIRATGYAAADVLLRFGAAVTVVDEQTGDWQQERAADLRARGATVLLADAVPPGLPPATQLVVTSPGFPPRAPLPQAAAAAGVPVWGDVELAWRLADRRTPWLVVTGTNGKTTTVRMLAAMLTAAGYRTVAAGNVGTPLLDAVLADPPYDVLAVELSSFQLHWTTTVEAYASAVLNVAPDHLDWHGSMEAYAAAKGLVYRGEPYAVHNADDPWAGRLAAGKKRVRSFTLGRPAAGQLGVADGVLLDCAYGTDDADRPAPRDGGVELAALDDVRPYAPHNVANALAAAALARTLGAGLAVPPYAVREGLRGFTAEPHRITRVADIAGVGWVDDSKATNPHAATASIAAYESVVWVAGGLAKGARFDDLVAETRERLRAVVLLGRDRADIKEALTRHAPDVPVVEVAETETGAMAAVVNAAARLARRGDTVLLAPACASMDMFDNYGARGDAFAAAVRDLAET